MTTPLQFQDLRLFLVRREYQCRAERRALEMWLGRLTPLRWFTVGAGSVLSAVAGATVLGSLFGDKSATISGLLALGSSVFTGLHVALKCDSHQSECRRMIQLYLSIERAYQAAQVQAPSDWTTTAAALEKRFEEIVATATVTAPHRFRLCAERETPNQSLEPTPTAGTSAAEQPLVPAAVVAHL